MSFLIPEDLEQLVCALEQKDDHTYLCAGGTDLLIHLRAKKKFHYSVIDLTHIDEIKHITEDEDQVVIGSGVTMAQLEKSTVIKKYFPALQMAASMVGSTQIRNRATLGGNIANASQSADTAPVLFALGAKAVVLNEKGEKKCCLAEDLVEGREKNRLADREMILEFHIPKKEWRSAFAKVGSRKSVTISKINGCIRTRVNQGIMEDTVVYLGAVGVKASRAYLIEKALDGKKLEGFQVQSVKDEIYRQIEENIPDRPSKHYKKSAAMGIVDTLLEELKKEGKEG